MHIRPMNPDELNHILALYLDGLNREIKLLNQIFPGKKVSKEGVPELKSIIRQMMQNNECKIFVAVKDKICLGYCLVTKKIYPVEEPKVCGCINGIFISPEVRKQGLGKQLFQAATDWLKNENITYLELYYSLNDVDAQAFWKKLGFTDVQVNCAKKL